MLIGQLIDNREFLHGVRSKGYLPSHGQFFSAPSDHSISPSDIKKYITNIMKFLTFGIILAYLGANQVNAAPIGYSVSAPQSAPNSHFGRYSGPSSVRSDYLRFRPNSQGRKIALPPVFYSEDDLKRDITLNDPLLSWSDSEYSESPESFLKKATSRRTPKTDDYKSWAPPFPSEELKIDYGNDLEEETFYGDSNSYDEHYDDVLEDLPTYGPKRLTTAEYTNGYDIPEVPDYVLDQYDPVCVSRFVDLNTDIAYVKHQLVNKLGARCKLEPEKHVAKVLRH